MPAHCALWRPVAVRYQVAGGVRPRARRRRTCCRPD